MFSSTVAMSPIGTHVRNAALSTAITLTAPAGAKCLVLGVETKNVRLTMDGTTTATAAVGFLLAAATFPYTLDVTEGVVISLIEVEASAVVNYQWSR